MANTNGSNGKSNNGFSFDSNGNGHGSKPPEDDNEFFEEDDDHDHNYLNIVQTRNLSAYEELTHEVITLEFHDRGLTLDFSSEEVQELGRVLNEVMLYLKRKPTIEP